MPNNLKVFGSKLNNQRAETGYQPKSVLECYIHTCLREIDLSSNKFHY
jgi:hypothetical protein